MKHSLILIEMVMILAAIACGTAVQQSADLSGSDLRDLKTGKRWRIEHDNGYIVRKECLTAVDCSTMREVLRLPLPVYEYRLQEANGVLESYRGENGAARLQQEMVELEQQLQNISIKPETRDGMRVALNALQDQKNYLSTAEDQLTAVMDKENKPLIKDSDGVYEFVDAAFQAKPAGFARPLQGRVTTVFIDPKSALVWMPIELPLANWFDANEKTRESDSFGNADQDQESRFGCGAVLGKGWRLPTLTEVASAIENGIRRHSTFTTIAAGWDYFWTSHVVAKPTTGAVYGVLATFASKESRHSSRWANRPIVCVVAEQDLRHGVNARYSIEK